jgi:hypothetical protein
MGRHKPFTIVLMVIGGICAAVLLAFLFGIFVKLLWNALMPDIFGLPEIGYWQAVGLVILGHLLLGGGHHTHKSRSRRHHRKSEKKERPHPEPCPEPHPHPQPE